MNTSNRRRTGQPFDYDYVEDFVDGGNFIIEELVDDVFSDTAAEWQLMWQDSNLKELWQRFVTKLFQAQVMLLYYPTHYDRKIKVLAPPFFNQLLPEYELGLKEVKQDYLLSPEFNLIESSNNGTGSYPVNSLKDRTFRVKYIPKPIQVEDRSIYSEFESSQDVFS